MKPWLAGFLACLLTASGCRHAPPRPVLTASPHYYLGAAYQSAGHWYYPEEDYALNATGVAAVLPPGPTGLTADGEIFDPTALVAAMQTVQLPAIAAVINLENGRQIMVRVNDRGPADPARLIALSPRAAVLLLIPPNGAARVRVEVDTVLSHRVVDQVGGGPKLSIATAPAGTVTAESLPPLGSAAGHGGGSTLGRQAATPTTATVPDRLPERILAMRPDPGQLWLRAGSFGRFDYANTLAARLAGLGGTVLRSRDGRQTSYAVRAGPFRTIPEADAALRRALGAGAIDAHITVEAD